MPDITDMPGNPAYGLKQAYKELMAITDPAELFSETMRIVEPYRSDPTTRRGMSEASFATFMRTMNKQQNSLVGMQKYITNFILKAGGEGVIEGEAWGEIVDNPADAIASMLTEDVNSSVEIQPWQQAIINIAKKNGIYIKWRSL